MGQSGPGGRILCVADDGDVATATARAIENRCEGFTAIGRGTIDGINRTAYDHVVAVVDPDERTVPDAIASLDSPLFLYERETDVDPLVSAIRGGADSTTVPVVERLHEVTRRLTEATTEEEVYERTVDAAERVLAFDWCVLVVARDGDLVPVAAAKDLPDDGYRRVPIDDESLAGVTYLNGVSRLTDDVRRLPEAAPADPGYRSLLSIPIGEFGVFQAVTDEIGSFSETDLELAELLLDHTAAIVRRLRFEAALRTERDRFAALFERIPDPIVGYRICDDGPVVTEVNPAFEEVFGYGPEIRGERLGDRIVPDDGRSVADELGRLAVDREHLDAEVRRTTADGLGHFLVRNVHVPGAPDDTGTEGYAIYTDITDRIERERTFEQLHDATRELITARTQVEVCEAIVDTASEVLDLPYSGTFLWNEQNGRLEGATTTDASREMIGAMPTFEPGEGIVGTAYESGERIVLDDVQTDDRAAGTSDGAIRGYCVLPLGDHGVMTVASPEVGAPDSDALQAISVLAGNAEVALDRLAVERTLRKRERDLAAQNRRLEEFASVVSHDLQTPLNVATGRIELARDEADDASNQDDHLEVAVDALGRMEALIGGLLEMARGGQSVGSVERVSLADAVDDAWKTVSVGADEAVLRTNLGGIAVEADPARLRQLLENLLNNAVEHAGPDVTVEVGTIERIRESDGSRERDGDDGSRERDSGGTRSYVGFYVADDGPGIPPDRREDVFTYGVTNGGTGIGLAVVEDVARTHGWSVDIYESEELGGTCFEIRWEP